MCILILSGLLSGSDMFRLHRSGITLNRTPWNECTTSQSSLGFWKHQHDAHCLDDEVSNIHKQVLRWFKLRDSPATRIYRCAATTHTTQLPATIALHASTLPHMVAMCSGVCPTLSSRSSISETWLSPKIYGLLTLW